MGPESLCDLLMGERGALIADGISQFQWNEANACKSGPGQNTWYQRGVGNLSAPSCPSGIAHFNMEFHYGMSQDAVVTPECELVQGEIRLLVIRGPDVKCIGQK